MPSKKKKKCPECPPTGAPEYMLTYGDMMTLLVTFFVLLISFSSMQEAKFHQAIGSLKGALGILKTDAGFTLRRLKIPAYSKKSDVGEHEIKKVIEQLKEATEKKGTHEMVKIEQSKDRIHFEISNPMLFDSGRAELKSTSSNVLDKIASVLNLLDFEVRVEGHTDNVPINTPRYPSNWELSQTRALSVVKYFISKGVEPSRFQAIGYGKYRPIATNETPEGRALNRRVEINVNLKDEKTSELFEESELKLLQ